MPQPPEESPQPPVQFTIARYVLPHLKREVHMIGTFVGVCWELAHPLDSTRLTLDRSGRPWIEIIQVLEGANGTPYIPDPNPAAGPLTVNEAEDLATQLLIASVYLKQAQKP